MGEIDEGKKHRGVQFLETGDEIKWIGIVS